MDKVSVTSCLDGYAFSENLGDQQWADNMSQVSGKVGSQLGKISHQTNFSSSGQRFRVLDHLTGLNRLFNPFNSIIETPNYTNGRTTVMKTLIDNQTVDEELNDQSSEVFASKSSSEDKDELDQNSIDDNHKPISVYMSASFRMLQQRVSQVPIAFILKEMIDNKEPG